MFSNEAKNIRSAVENDSLFSRIKCARINSMNSENT